MQSVKKTKQEFFNEVVTCLFVRVYAMHDLHCAQVTALKRVFFLSHTIVPWVFI